MSRSITRQIRVYGIVQGVGFRPTVSRHAMETGITGSVCNKGPYVEIFVQGTEEQVEAFLDALDHRPPKRAAILKMDVKEAADPPEFDAFDIIESEKTKGEIFVSPDIAICDECIEEMNDPKNRRYQHPFINCTCCGPRLTILDALPYDRERTSMKEFPMCPDCASEYYDPETRRYDAQPVCCNDCGPEVYIMDRPEHGREAITYARRIIADGGVVAVKGIGGFHLACDATNEEAVSRLRKLKTRPMKPFAVMMRDWTVVERECVIAPEQEEILRGHQKPILLLDKKEGGKLCPSIAPDNPKVGVMLPYAPVQILLFDYDDGITMPDCLVMTSGNVSGAPICREDKDVKEQLSGFCDAVLSHNRKIRIRADDSVMDFYRGQPYMIRRSRGYAPLPYILSHGFQGRVLATGGELKNTFCVGVNDLFYPSSYVGDLADLRTVDALEETIGRLQTLLETEPALVACDLHPKYNSTLVAEEMGKPLIQVQHHYAHIVSCMAENDHEDPVLGVSFDGTGYGTDGTIWGGEILQADYRGFSRIGSIAPFLQMGGDHSSREGWRIACSMILREYEDPEKALDVIRQLKLCDDNTAKVQRMMFEKRINTVDSTSVGRLFDAVSAILGIRKASTFEGEAATSLQFAAQRGMKRTGAGTGWNGELRELDGRKILPTDDLVADLLKKRLAGEDPEVLAYEFHDALAAMAAKACIESSRETGIRTAALSGGCYQNTLLLELTQRRLEEAGMEVLVHHLVPPNDGGIALGQAVVAMQALEDHANQ